MEQKNTLRFATIRVKWKTGLMILMRPIVCVRVTVKINYCDQVLQLWRNGSLYRPEYNKADKRETPTGPLPEILYVTR